MNYYNLITQRETDNLPNTIGIYKGITWPRDKQIFLDAGWRLVEFPNPPPEGMVVTSTTYTEKDAETVTKAQTWMTPDDAEHARQAAKPPKVKNRELKMKNLLLSLGFSVPVPQDDIDNILPALMAQIEALLADNKDKDAIRLMSKAVAMLALWVTLGDDVFAKYLGEGGVNE